MSWINVQITTHTPDEAEALSDALLSWGALSISLQDAADQPLYEPALGTTPVWAQTQVLALFPEETDLETVMLLLIQSFGETIVERVQIDELPVQDWKIAWKAYSKPLCFGSKLWILPDRMDPVPENTPNAVSLYLPPGLAFGTGNHPTTALCLEWLSTHSLQHLSVLDYGCGSGILGLAAARLGAAKVVGVDHDPQALEAMLENARENHLLTPNLEVYLPKDMPSIQFDLVIANILAEPLIVLAEEICFYIRSHGRLVMAGLLESELDRVRSAYEEHIEWMSKTHCNDWVCIEGIKRAAMEG